MLSAYLAALRATILGTLPLALLAWVGVELLWGSITRRRAGWEGVSLRFLCLWSLAIFLSVPAAEWVWHPLQALYVSLFGLGVLAWAGTAAYRLLTRRRGP